MTNCEWIPPILPSKIWRLTTVGGSVLAEMWHDDPTGHYLARIDGKPRGSMGANWNEAKAKCEALLAPKKGKR